MKMISFLQVVIFILLAIHQMCGAAEDTELPKWINELRLNSSKTLRTEINVFNIKMPDPLKDGKYFLFCLKSEGSLDKVHDPFEAMHKMFSSSGWRYVLEYQADGHGSSSFAYEKGNYFSNIYVNIDSSCDDEETGHVPSKFWLEIYCREK